MIRREGKGPPSRDLLVCFPTRSHLTLMPKAVSSPRRHHHHHHHHQNHLRKSIRGGGGHASPYLKQMSSAENTSEPTSPKVTCAGQIKVVRPRTGSACKNWQTVMEEIERLHINRKMKKKPNWVETLGFKKEVMQFLACLRRIKFDFRCMGSFSHVDVTSDDDEDDEGINNNDKEIDQNQEINQDDHDEQVSSRTIFSKWFMVLQENNNQGVFSEDEKSSKTEETEDRLPCLPPANALLLMRCRSAPAKSWMEEKQEEKDDDNDDDDDDGHDEKVEEEEHADDDDGDDDNKKKVEKKEKKRKSLMELMKNDQNDFYKLSSDIVKETWVIGGIHKDPFSRSRSWKR